MALILDEPVETGKLVESCDYPRFPANLRFSRSRTTDLQENADSFFYPGQVLILPTVAQGYGYSQHNHKPNKYLS